jgi:pyruvate, water dikinase
MSLIDLFSRKNTCSLLVNVDGKVVEKYRYFKDFLTHNRDALNHIAELEQTYYGASAFSMASVKGRYEELLASTRKLAEALNGIAKGRYAGLSEVCDRINEEVAHIVNPRCSSPAGDLVLPFEALSPEMVTLAGSKATNLATLHHALGLPIPQGFVITADAFVRFLDDSGLAKPIAEMLTDITPEMTQEMEAKSKTLQEMVLQVEVPPPVADAICKAYEALAAKTRQNVRIAMRSSAVGEDTEASFAGQYITELNVTRENILHAYKAVVASKYAPRAILYRLRYGLDDRDTPMCVAGIVMIDSQSSGVLYTVDPSRPDSTLLKISSIWGLGEHLVGGEASPDVFYVDRSTYQISQRDISRKETRLINLDGGGTLLEEVPEDAQALPSIDDSTVGTLAGYGLMLEEYFKGPQDVEWALDSDNNLFILQSRPLGLIETKGEADKPPQVFPNHPILLSSGKAASTGTATGVVFIAGADNRSPIPDDAILVAKTASPDYAALMGKVKGIITDIGSVASHLASVAREFGLPAIFDAGNATSSLKDGESITMVADTTTVYQRIVPELAAGEKPSKKHIFESPVHRRMRAVLDQISPLNLTDPKDPSFTPEGCRTIHDIIRFAHENAMKEMFGLSGQAGGDVTAVKLTANIPLPLYCIDLGEGLKGGLTTCDTITPDHIESIPMKALWSGLSHPGITWSGGINVNVGSFMNLMASSAAADAEGVLGADSYALLSRDYLNLSAKFGYHYANVDTYCGEEPSQNYIALQFSGGAGAYYGRSLRINFLANVLGRLGFAVTVTGDLLEANLTGYDIASMEKTLDQLGRLLAVSRLLDMAIPNQAAVDRMTEAFFSGDYDFLSSAESRSLPGFYTHTGDWKTVVEDGKTLCLQDGSSWGGSMSSGLANLMGKMVGAKYQEFLDNVGAYYYFPIAIAKESAVSDAILQVKVRALAGSIDRAGGLVFGLRNVGNYFVLRLNALEDNFVLFEFINNRRFQRATFQNKIETRSFVNPFHRMQLDGATVQKQIETGKWYDIKAEISGHTVKGYLDDELLIEYTAERPLNGHVGLWTKADSVTHFDELTIEANGSSKRISW